MIPNNTVIFSLSPCIISEKSENDTYTELNTMEVIQSECNMLSVPLTSHPSVYISGKP